MATALTTIPTQLGASLEQLEWTVNAYVPNFAVLMMTAAALGDRGDRTGVCDSQQSDRDGPDLQPGVLAR